jgi:hypothetical protein
MHHRVAIRAEHGEILSRVVLTVVIFMMDAENFWHRIKAARFTFRQGAACGELLSDGGEMRIPKEMRRFVVARSTAIDPWMARRRPHRFLTMPTTRQHGATTDQGLVITSPRTVFGRFRAKRNDRERGGTDAATNRDAIMSRVPSIPASTRAKPKRLTTIFGNVN